jgi:hypothetical protein
MMVVIQVIFSPVKRNFIYGSNSKFNHDVKLKAKGKVRTTNSSGVPAGWNTCTAFCRAKKVKGEKRQGCRFSPAQGIEAEPKTFVFWFAEFALR